MKIWILSLTTVVSLIGCSRPRSTSGTRSSYEAIVQLEKLSEVSKLPIDAGVETTPADWKRVTYYPVTFSIPSGIEASRNGQDRINLSGAGVNVRISLIEDQNQLVEYGADVKKHQFWHEILWSFPPSESAFQSLGKKDAELILGRLAKKAYLMRNFDRCYSINGRGFLLCNSNSKYVIGIIWRDTEGNPWWFAGIWSSNTDTLLKIMSSVEIKVSE